MSSAVLLVEGDEELRTTVRLSLSIEGYQVLAAASLADALSLWRKATDAPNIDLVLLGLELPDGDGADLLQQIRAEHNTSVIVISARNIDAEKVQLLDSGPHDYLFKPFSIGELLARMRVALHYRGRQFATKTTQYAYSDLTIDLLAHRVMNRGEVVHLTPTEYKLLARLVPNAGQVVTHRQLLRDVWGAEFIEHTHYLRHHMAQLRSKLESDPAEPIYLLTEPGLGYRLADPEIVAS
jgi:two-component system, OmpR family, KDP operon response regulator KdpE